MKSQESVYLPLMEDFKKQTESLYDKLWKKDPGDKDLSGLFIPHAFKGYDKAKKKIFFVGQDTYNWTNLNSFYDLNARQYLKENNKWPQDVDTVLEWTNPYTFWNFVCRLQLALNGMDYSLEDMTKDKRKVLEGIGWGNIYSLEIPETVAKYGEEFNSLFDRNVYKELLEQSQNISKLRNLIEAFDPDYIVILAPSVSI